MQFDEKVFDLVEMKQGLASKEFFGFFPQDGLLTASWNGSTTDTALTTIVLKAKMDGFIKDAISLNSRFMSPEAYINNDLLRLELGWIEKSKSIYFTEVKQNFPNPFTETTNVWFQIPTQSLVKWSITDVTGRLIKQSNQWFSAGEHVLDFEKNTFHSPGIYYFTIESAEYKRTLKMVKFE